MFDFSIANPNSTLVLCVSLYFVIRRTPRSCRAIPIPLASPIILSDTDTTLSAWLNKSRLIPPTISTNLYTYPFYARTSRLPPRVLASGPKPCEGNHYNSTYAQPTMMPPRNFAPRKNPCGSKNWFISA